jgi:acyl-CoA thioester hydrolase
MDDLGFATEVRVRFAETDAQGVAHHANYLVWFEAARVAYLAEFAGGYQAIRDQGFESFVLEAHIRYRQPARFDDTLQIRTRVGELRGARFRFDYAVMRADELLADGWTSHACVDARTFRPTRIPTALAESIARAEALSLSSSS